MIRGHIIKNRPFIGLTVAWKESVQDVVVLIDTGFTGEIKITKEVATDLNLEVTGVTNVQLGDRQEAIMATALALVSISGVSRVVTVLIGEGDVLVGMGLLKKFNCLLTLNFANNTLQIERMT